MNISSTYHRVRIVLTAGVMLLPISGCYLAESARGQLALLMKREPISRVTANPATSPQLRTLLEEVTSIRDFASRELKLPDNGSYRSYADLRRSYVVWNVVAAPEFSVQAKQWCYPVVGCVAYRGYFSERKARQFAQRLRGRGFDVSVSGVAAYSTLGHFDDPILNTMTGWNDVDLAAIIFHELTHQLLYVRGDASFDEAFATVVEEEGVRRWLTAQGRNVDLVKHFEEQANYLRVVDLLREARPKLAELYASGIGADAMRASKKREIDAVRAAYAALSKDWQYPPFQSWFQGELNNAQLASIGTYYDCVPGLQRELEATHADLAAFYARVRRLAAVDQAARDAAVCVLP